jgi:hypothetical protein
MTLGSGNTVDVVDDDVVVVGGVGSTEAAAADDKKSDGLLFVWNGAIKPSRSSVLAAPNNNRDR